MHLARQQRSSPSTVRQICAQGGERFDPSRRVTVNGFGWNSTFGCNGGPTRAQSPSEEMPIYGVGTVTLPMFREAVCRYAGAFGRNARV